MTLDIAMGGSTNTVLHLLAAAQAAEVPFTMEDIDLLSRKTPNLCKVAPSSDYHVQDVHRAGGVLGIMAELDRLGLLETSVTRAEGRTLAETLEQFDLIREDASEDTRRLYSAAPGDRGRNLKFGSQDRYYRELDLDRRNGCIRDGAHAYTAQGGLAVLFGNIARSGCIVKTAGVHPSNLQFTGTARVFESQDQAVEGILGGAVTAGDVVVIRYEGPKGGPGMQEMLYPTSYIRSMKLDTSCALITDGRFSGGTSGLSIGHISPEAASGGEIALVEDGDSISIDIPERVIRLDVGDEELRRRRERQEARGEEAFTPQSRTRRVSAALRSYAFFAESADKGAIRSVPEVAGLGKRADRARETAAEASKE